MRTYRRAFLLALAGNIVLIGGLATLWSHYRTRQSATNEPSMRANAVEASENPSAAATASAETPLVPVQLSPQKLQSIGVKISEVQRKVVADEIRATGNVAVDETRLAYIQTRFSGYIQKVFADATYQYVRKGQPLFTIYSPDLVATEREYVVAKQNQQQVVQSPIPGVASGAASLLDAAAERLKQWGVPQREIERLESSGQVQQALQVASPASRYITETSSRNQAGYVRQRLTEGADGKAACRPCKCSPAVRNTPDRVCRSWRWLSRAAGSAARRSRGR